MRALIAAVIVTAVAAVAPHSLDAKRKPLSGDWTFSVEHLGLKLVLDEKSPAITGTLDWPHGDPIKLTGLAAADSVMLSGDSAGENFTVHVDSMASIKTDGTLAGTLKALFVEYNDSHQVVRTRVQEIPWTAARGLHGVVHFPR